MIGKIVRTFGLDRKHPWAYRAVITGIATEGSVEHVLGSEGINIKSNHPGWGAIPIDGRTGVFAFRDALVEIYRLMDGEKDPDRRTDWDGMAREVCALIKRLQCKPNKAWIYVSPGSILNAYRKGDRTFKQALKLLKRWNLLPKAGKVVRCQSAQSNPLGQPRGFILSNRS